MPTIIVEDGSGVENANSYVSVDDFLDYASDRGFDLPDNGVEVMLIKAFDYIESKSSQYQGDISYSDQTIAFPRKGMYFNGVLYPSDKIPFLVIKAQLQAALEIAKGIDLMPTTSGAFVKREKVGPIETEYSETIAASVGNSPDTPYLDSLMASLYGSQGGFFLRSRRI